MRGSVGRLAIFLNAVGGKQSKRERRHRFAEGILMAVLIAMFISGKTENYVKNPSSFGSNKQLFRFAFRI